jgi:GT2 family glycosyltransferase
MDLSILIVTYNSAPLIGGLLDHLQAEILSEGESLRAEIIVVDNASRDGTVHRIRADHPSVRVVASAVNLGFAAGNNLAAQHARGRHLLLLNPDALPESGALRRGVAWMDANPKVGLGGGELLGTDGSRQPSARMFPTLRDEVFTLSGLAARHPSSRLFARMDRRWADPDADAAVDWIPGAFVFIPAALFKTIGGFDERFFMYYEEVTCAAAFTKGVTLCGTGPASRQPTSVVPRPGPWRMPACRALARSWKAGACAAPCCITANTTARPVHWDGSLSNGAGTGCASGGRPCVGSLTRRRTLVSTASRCARPGATRARAP